MNNPALPVIANGLYRSGRMRTGLKPEACKRSETRTHHFHRMAATHNFQTPCLGPSESVTVQSLRVRYFDSSRPSQYRLAVSLSACPTQPISREALAT